MVQAEDLYSLRKKLGLSQEKLAEELGVSRNTISRWERGSFSPSAESMVALNRLCAQFEDSTKLAGGPTVVPESDAPAPAKSKRWPMILMCVGVVCALLIGIVSLIGVYSIRQRLNPADNAIPMEELEEREVDVSSTVQGTRLPLQP